jgi:hypothetical protein
MAPERSMPAVRELQRHGELFTNPCHHAGMKGPVDPRSKPPLARPTGRRPLIYVALFLAIVMTWTMAIYLTRF